MSNKQMVINFYHDVFEHGDLSHLDKYMKANYIQHSPEVEDHRQGFIKFIKIFLSLRPKFKILNVSADKNMVYVFFKCILKNGHVNKVCDIYRIKDHKLAEHWDIIEKNVENIHSNNPNGIF